MASGDVYDAIVVGAGPAGGMAARQLAGAGFRTLVVDKKKILGEPVQCAEGVSQFGLESNGIRPHDEWVAQRVTGARCVLPNGTSFFITQLPGYAIDRPAFDRWLVHDAESRGAEVRTSTRVTAIAQTDRGWRVQANGESIPTRVVIAADGPMSHLARSLGLVGHHELIRAYEFRFRNGDIDVGDPERFLLYVGRRYDGGYAWIFPKGDDVNVGAGGHIDAHAALLAFCRDRGFDPARRVQSIAGTVPYRIELRAHAIPGFAVVGDAAGVTNAMNGAGIHSGLFSGRVAGDFACHALEQDDVKLMAEYDAVVRASPFLDPLLFWMIERIRRWDDRLLNAVGEEVNGRSWREIDLRLALAAIVRNPRVAWHGREFYRMLRALELCEHFGW